MSARRVDALVAAAVATVVLGPMLWMRGFALRGDMVFVPHQPWKPAWLGLDGSAPRFVPGDAVLSVLTVVVPGDLLQKLILFGGLVLGGVGAATLVGAHRGLARAAVTVFFLWNPWVFERLAIGQWGFVLGYALLPWIVLAAARVRSAPRQAWPTLALWLAASSLCSPPAALMAAATALCVVGASRRWRPTGAVVAIVTLVNLPWVVPSLTAARDLDPVGAQFAAFAARGESALGIVPSLLSFGGIWKTSIVPDERTVVPLLLLSCVPTVLGLAFVRRVWPRDPQTMTGLAVLAAGCLLVALLPAVESVARLLDDGAHFVPALGLLRDSQRYLAPAVLVLLPGLAEAVDLAWDRARPGREALRALAVVLVVWPVLCLPTMAWGMAGRLEAVTYPGEWEHVASLLGDDNRTVVLPWRGTYRGFGWNDRRAMLDPSTRYFRGEVLVDDRHFFGDDPHDPVLSNEDPRLARVTSALAAPDPAAALAALGVDRVLLEKHNGAGQDQLPAGKLLHDGPGLALVELPGSGAGVRVTPWAPLIIATDVGWVVVVFAAIASSRRRSVYGSPE
jgi:hypothetical protein